MEIHLLAFLWFGSLAGIGDSSSEEVLNTFNSTFGSKNNSLVNNLNLASAKSAYHKGLDNSTRNSLHENKFKPENISTNRPPGHSLAKQDASINISKEREIITNYDAISKTEHEEDNSNQTKWTHSNATERKQIIEAFRNNTKGHGGNEGKLPKILWPKQYERQEPKNTSHPSFSITPRSSIINRNLKIRLREKTQDFARDCFDDLRKYMGSKACYTVQCTNNGVNFFIRNEEAARVKPVVEFEVGRGLRSTNDCIVLPGTDPSSKICIEWSQMKWSRKHFRGCVSAKVSDETVVIRKTTLSCYKLNCEENKWQSKWLKSPRPPLRNHEGTLITKSHPSHVVNPSHEQKPTFSRPSPNPNVDSNFMLSKDDAIYSVDQLDIDNPVEEEEYTTTRVFDYIETLPPLNIGNRPATRESKKLGNKPKPGNGRESKNKPKPWNTHSLENKPLQKQNKPKPKTKPQQQIKRKPKNKPHQKQNKPKPKTKPQQLNEKKVGNKPHQKENKPKTKSKPQQSKEQKLVKKPHKQENNPKTKTKTQQQINHKPGNKPHQKQNEPKSQTKPQQPYEQKQGKKQHQKENKPKPNTKNQQQIKRKEGNKSHQKQNKPPQKKNKQKPESKHQQQLKHKQEIKSKPGKNYDKDIGTTQTQTNVGIKNVQHNDVLDKFDGEVRTTGEDATMSSLLKNYKQSLLANAKLFSFVPQEYSFQPLSFLDKYKVNKEN